MGWDGSGTAVAVAVAVRLFFFVKHGLKIAGLANEICFFLIEIIAKIAGVMEWNFLKLASVQQMSVSWAAGISFKKNWGVNEQPVVEM